MFIPLLAGSLRLLKHLLDSADNSSMVLEGAELKKKKKYEKFCCFLVGCIMNKTNKPNSKPHCVRAGGSTVIVQSRRHKGEVRETFRELVDSTHKPGLILPTATARTAQ